MSRYFCRLLLTVLAGLAWVLAGTALPARAADDSGQTLSRFFQSKTKDLPAAPIDFQINAGYAMLRTGNPESTGRYAMTSINLVKVAPDIYRVDMALEKPLARDIPTYEPPFFFTENRTYYFWYQNGTEILFKVGSKRVPVKLGRKDVTRVDIHPPDTYTVNRQSMLQNISFEDGATTIHLQLKFN
ncbi:hypothetical protein [Desulfovibrio sp. TomC]|uniref:hypothetical protein n=1 Tax=Desulfovibrio sp. TomC TaxID=1562888 RepID=UPI00057497A6|nr:hypothetical protein [Desulfovibrio sp. TomC]KHK01310.1 hypothetical protein NY78_3292 [Desulfovibrio sp. TomC]